jgi:hypothetical protein
MVQIHSPRPNFSSRIIILRRKFCCSCEFFCVLGALLFKLFGRYQSFSSEFIALRREFHFTASPFLEKLGTGSRFWEKNQKPKLKSCTSPTMSPYVEALITIRYVIFRLPTNGCLRGEVVTSRQFNLQEGLFTDIEV